MKNQKNIIWAARIIAAIVMLQTLFFKFTAAPESVYIFSSIGAEPFGRIGSGIAELIASCLLLYPRSSWFGALMGMGIMTGAIATHLFILGIEIMNDGGQLFFMALLTFICCVVVLFYEKEKVLVLVKIFKK